MVVVKVGCCGFARGVRRYFPQFQVVEVQQTFYKPPRIETALGWRRQAPPNFEFTVKAWQLITHLPSSPTYSKAGIKVPPGTEDRYGFFRPTEEVLVAWQRTKELAQALEARVVLFQCPPRFGQNQQNIGNMKAFFGSIDRGGLILVWEPRGNWTEEGIVSLCQELALIHCVDPLESRSLYGRPRYFRLHGSPGYRHVYTDDELNSLAGMGQDGDYFLFNNLAMYDDALRFKRLIRGAE